MTNREFLEKVINTVEDAELVEYATMECAKLDKANAKKREKAMEKAAEKQPLREALFDHITVEPKSAATLVAETEMDINPKSVPSLLKPYIEKGMVVKTEIKVVGKGKQRGYAIASVEDCDNTEN